MEASLSAAGFQKVDATIKLNHTEGELMNNFDSFDEDLYWFTIMGEPSADEPWGWQIDGHHLVVNYFLSGDQVVMTPVFMGAEPTVAPEGTDYEGLSVLITEQDKGLAMINALDADQQATAIINPTKSGADMQAGANGDNAVIPYAGINAGELTVEQQDQLLDLIAEWVGNLADDQAGLKMAEVQAHLDETYFSWIGDTGADAVFYYRIQSPVLLIEFDHQEPGPLGRASDYYQGASDPQRAHIHSIVRTPNGNDYGKDLLAQHYATSPLHTGSPEVGTPVAALALVGAVAARPLASYFWSVLPERYRNDRPVSNAPMGAGDLVYGEDGAVAWDETWGAYCDLALAGGPPHRGTLLKAPDPTAVAADAIGQEIVLDELARALGAITGWEVRRDAPGWIGLVCPDTTDAAWLRRAILVENVAARYEGNVLYLPAGPTFRVEHEIKNVVNAVAKTHHYWTEHALTAR